jgi:hypothetical protein
MGYGVRDKHRRSSGTGSMIGRESRRFEAAWRWRVLRRYAVRLMLRAAKSSRKSFAVLCGGETFRFHRVLKTNLRMKKIYIHCGFHKTGSTAVQIALSQNAERLRTEGYLYAHTGLVGDRMRQGHHNIAWELAGDRRFDRRMV